MIRLFFALCAYSAIAVELGAAGAANCNLFIP